MVAPTRLSFLHNRSYYAIEFHSSLRIGGLPHDWKKRKDGGHFIIILELHVVWLIVRAQSEASGQVTFQHFCASDNLQEDIIDFLLLGFALFTHNSGLGCITGEKLLLSFFLFVLVSGKEFIGNGGNIDLTDINLGAGGNHVGGVDTAQWDSIDFVGTRYQQETGFQQFEAYDALSTESACQNNDHGSRSDRFANSGWVLLYEMHFFGRLGILSGVIAGSFLLRAK